jgi:hypothetical protein
MEIQQPRQEDAVMDVPSDQEKADKVWAEVYKPHHETTPYNHKNIELIGSNPYYPEHRYTIVKDENPNFSIPFEESGNRQNANLFNYRVEPSHPLVQSSDYDDQKGT